MGSFIIILLMRKLCFRLFIGDMYEIFLYGNKGFDLKGVRYNLIELYGRDFVNDKKIRGVYGIFIKGEFECVWVGVGGEMGKFVYKINVLVYFLDYMFFFIRDVGIDF